MTTTFDTNETIFIDGIRKFLDFFKEFNYVPSFRAFNTISILAKNNVDDAINYIVGYFRIIDSVYANIIAEKVKDPEFKLIINQLSLNDSIYSDKIINNRLKIYYGEPGTCKTTKATAESDGICIFYYDGSDFDIKLRNLLILSIENGWKICIDGINFLSPESFQFIQYLIDGKDYYGKNIVIKDGFQIIGIVDTIYGRTPRKIPELIVDRCSEIVEFTSTEDYLS